MKADPRFSGLDKAFWAHVRLISEQAGYTIAKEKLVKAPGDSEIREAMSDLGLKYSHLFDEAGRPSSFGGLLREYFEHRAGLLNTITRPLLMDGDEAGRLFRKVRSGTRSKLPVTMNKQRGKKRKPAYLTNIIRMIISHELGSDGCDFDPQRLTSITKDGVPLRTLSRRVDGAFPSAVDSIAVWEIKEYYHNTTFGSRVSDGVYESQLDGMELDELRKNEGRNVWHYLFLDGRFNWWEKGRSYLCRIIDMLHMGLVDEVIVGRECVSRLPELCKRWKEQLDK